MTRHRLSFLLHPSRNGTLWLTARLTCHAWQKIDVALGISLPDASAWDHARQRAVPKSRQLADLNYTIAAIERDVEGLFTRAALDGRTPTRAEAAACLKSSAGREEAADGGSMTIAQGLDLYAQSALGWSESTRKKHRTLSHHVADYAPTTPLQAVGVEWMEGLARHLIRAGHNNRTTAKEVKMMKAALRWLTARGIYHGDGATYAPKLKDGGNGVIFLTIDELRRMEALKLHGTAEQVRDTFVFCCYTGLRYSDAATLRREDDKGDHIEVVTRKTGDRLTIDLNSHARGILDKWRHCNKALPAISNQKSNEWLKSIARACGITQPVSRVRWSGSVRTDEVVEKCMLIGTHTARRTFVVTALTLGIPAEVVMRWTGHKDYNAMKPYIAIVDELKRREMDRFDGI